MKSKFFLALAYFIFLALSFKTLTGGLQETWNKLSADDHYAWILKNSQLTECFTQDCRYLKDAREQLNVDFSQYSFDLNYKRWREQHCLFDIYTLLYTAHMSLYKKVFNLPNYETAYEWVAYTNFFAVSLCLLLFLSTIFGHVPAAIALLLMCLSRTGWLYFGIMTPSFVITGLSLGLLALYAKKPHLLLRLLPVIIILMSLYHSIGKLYSIGLLILLAIHYNKKIKADKSLQIQFALPILSLVALGLLGFVETPQFKLISFPFLDNSERLHLLAENIQIAIRAFAAYFYIGPINTLIVGLANIGIIYLLLRWLKAHSAQHKTPVYAVSFFFILTLISPLHLLKNIPGELTGRLSVPLFASLCGLVGYLFVHSVFKTNFKPQYKKIFLTATALFTIVLYFNFTPYNTYFNTPRALAFNDSQNNFYDPQQVQKLFNSQGECGTVLYMSQTPMWVYTTYGALKCGAIIGYVWQDLDPTLPTLIKERQDLSHFVSFNPIFNRLGTPLLSSDSALEILYKDPPQSPFYMQLKTELASASVTVLRANEANSVIDTQNLELAANQTKSLEINIQPGQKLQISVNSGVIQLEKASFSQNLHWPWSNKTLFRFLKINESGNVLDTMDIDLMAWVKSVENYYKIKIEPIDDSKSTVLMGVTKQ